LTQIKYNTDGDLLFTAGKDKSVNVWFSANGERLGTYDGHQGVVWSIDSSKDSKYLLTGSGDFSSIYWDLETGTILERLDHHAPVRSVGFSYTSKEFFLTTDAMGNRESEIYLYDTRDSNQMKNNKPWQSIVCRDHSKLTCAVWGPKSQILITGHDNGDLCHFQPKTGDRITISSHHDGRVNDLQHGRDGLLLISASKDQTSRLFDPFSLNPIKLYKTDRPVNSAGISPIKDHIIMGGGQEAQDVTTTAGKVGKFEAKVYHMIYEEEFARVKGHFGPINSIAINPDGKSYSSGGEEGYVRIHHFDENYLEFDFDQ
jgi:translation initiation factor 3 subunit I